MGAWGKCGGPPARLAQSVERKALNLVVVGSSPTVGDLPPAWGPLRPPQTSIFCINVFDVGRFVPMRLEFSPPI